jgi:hypothetical protein
MNLGWADIPFNRGNSLKPTFEHVIEGGEIEPREAFSIPGFNLIYDFETDTIYSVEAGYGSEREFLQGVAEDLEQYEASEL